MSPADRVPSGTPVDRGAGGEDWGSVAELLGRELPDSTVRGAAPLGALTTYRIGGAAAIGVEVGSRRDLLRLAEHTARRRWPVLVVGLGSNMLVSDSGFDGLAVRLGAPFSLMDIEAPRVAAGAGAPMPVVARRCAAAGLGGFGWAVGVPGTIGGAIRMNAGGHGSDMSEVTLRAEVVDLATGEAGDATAEDLGFGYRTSSLTGSQVVIEVELGLQESERGCEEEVIREVVAWRRLNQPGGANSGSVFKNPPGDSAGRLVEEAGCKGLRHRSATVSERHANFIQADPGGSAGDVLALMSEVTRRVETHSGVRLLPETHLVGFDPAGLDLVEAEPVGSEPAGPDVSHRSRP